MLVQGIVNLLSADGSRPLVCLLHEAVARPHHQHTPMILPGVTKVGV